MSCNRRRRAVRQMMCGYTRYRLRGFWRDGGVPVATAKASAVEAAANRERSRGLLVGVHCRRGRGRSSGRYVESGWSQAMPKLVL